VPFVQGRLRGEHLSARIETECAHCHQPLQVELDSDLNFTSVAPETQPLVYAPLIDFDKLQDPSIIDAF
jgi:uncharacterized metal-binding protein YceD (DUF177 family)